MNNDQHLAWERQQAELWDRIFQATQDVVLLADTLEGGAGMAIVKDKMVRSAMDIGSAVVRATAADERPEFLRYLHMARLQSIETDYWLRLAYVLQQRDELQRDLSGMITQYAAIIDLLQKFSRHAQTEVNVLARHTKGPRLN